MWHGLSMTHARSRATVSGCSAGVLPALVAIGLLTLGACTAGHVGAREDVRMDANCDLVALTARAPEPQSVALTDSAVREMGGQALADILQYCSSIDPWTADLLHAYHSLSSPGGRSAGGPSLLLQISPAALAQKRRTCGKNYEQYERVGPVSHAPYRERGYLTFDSCGLETREILKVSDLDYVRPPSLHDWRIHQILLESEVPKDIANRYFTAILLAAEAYERAPGTIVVRKGRIEAMNSDGDSEVQSLASDGRLEELSRRWLSEVAWISSDLSVSGCVSGSLSIAATEPIANLRWLLDLASENSEQCESSYTVSLDHTLTLAVAEREELFRPLRAEFDIPAPESKADLELILDSSGEWRADDGTAGARDAAALTSTLDRLQPSSLRVRTNPGTAASKVVDLLRVPDVWSARGRRELKMWLVIEDDDTE